MLVYAGRLAFEKNVSLLIEVMQHLSEQTDAERYRLLLVGDGDAKLDLMHRAESTLPGTIHFAAHRPDADALAAILSACDIFVHPNPCEPFGIAPLEAMAAGIPLVAPASGGVLSYATPSNAWLAPARAADFASTIVRAVNDPVERYRKVAAARQTAMSNGWPEAAARFLDLYAQISALVRRAERPPAHLEAAFFSTR